MDCRKNRCGPKQICDVIWSKYSENPCQPEQLVCEDTLLVRSTVLNKLCPIKICDFPGQNLGITGCNLDACDYGDGSNGDAIFTGAIIFDTDIQFKNLTVLPGANIEIKNSAIIQVQETFTMNDGIISSIGEAGGAGAQIGIGSGQGNPGEGEGGGSCGKIVDDMPQGGGGGGNATEGFDSPGGATGGSVQIPCTIGSGGGGGTFTSPPSIPVDNVKGGNGGAGGGVITIYAKNMNLNNVFIQVIGSRGSDGKNDDDIPEVYVAGGGGGSGGKIELCANTIEIEGVSLDAQGGTGGRGGQTALNGGKGGDGCINLSYLNYNDSGNSSIIPTPKRMKLYPFKEDQSIIVIKNQDEQLCSVPINTLIPSYESGS